MKTLSESLAAAQAEMGNIAFDSVNPHFKNKFVSLAGVRQAVLPVLNKHGVFVTQELTSEQGRVGCKTIFLKGEERLEIGPLWMPVTKADAQGFGSAATYARRYSLMAACGVVGDEDDDGNAAVDPVAKVVAAKVAPAAGVLESLEPDTQQAIRNLAAEIQEAFDKAGVAESHKILMDSEGYSADEKVALWSLLNSTCRSALKKYINEQRKAA